MLSNIPGVLNPASAMLSLVRQSRDDQETSRGLVQRTNHLLSSIRPSTIIASMHARLDISRQVAGLRERANLRFNLVDVIVQLHGDGPVYGTIRRNNINLDTSLKLVEDTNEQAKNKINHAIQLNRVHSELATMQNFVA